MLVLKCLIFFLVIRLNHSRYRDNYPDAISNEWQREEYMYFKFERMSEWVGKDVTLKLRHATKVQSKYRNQISYHLGSIAAGIQEHFRHMLKVYRKYSNLTDFRKNSFYIDEYFDAYHSIKGDYNEIRFEKSLYYKIKAENDERERKDRRIIEKYNELLKKSKRTYKPFRRSMNDKADKDEEEYKRSLRLQKWEEKWNNFIPEVEGVNIDIPDILPDSGKPHNGTVNNIRI